MSYGCEKLSIPFVVENVTLKALYCAVQVVKSFYTFVVENELGVVWMSTRIVAVDSTVILDLRLIH